MLYIVYKLHNTYGIIVNASGVSDIPKGGELILATRDANKAVERYQSLSGVR